MKIVRYSSLPVHLRWELYPVAHETRREYGGSCYEEIDGVNKPPSRNITGELKFMGKELFLFHLYLKEQKNYWYLVYPFHLGIFLLLCWFILLIIGALISGGGLNTVSELLSARSLVFYYLVQIVGIAGFGIAGIACLGLLIKRLTDRAFKLYTSPAYYSNLIFILLITASGLAAGISFNTYNTAAGFVRSVITVSPVIDMNPATYINILLICIFLIFSPFTRMTHYVAKYFTYHKVLWDDRLNSEIANSNQKIKELLEQAPDWSGSHVPHHQNWAQIAKNTPKDNSRGPV